MVLQVLDLVEAGALFDLRRHGDEVLFVGGGHLEYVGDAVEDDDEYLRVVGGEELTEGRENALLQHVRHLFTLAWQCQVVDAPRRLSSRRQITLLIETHLIFFLLILHQNLT